MNEQVLEVTGNGDGRFVWWNAGPCDKAVMQKIFNGRKSTMLSCSTELPNLQTTLDELADNLNLKVRGQPIRIEPLKTGVRGFEVHRIVKGDEQNQHVFLFSARLTDTGTVELLEYDADNLPPGWANGIANYEQWLTDTWSNKEQVLPTKFSSDLLAELILTHLSGVRIKGGFFHVPESSVAEIESVSQTLKENTASNLDLCSLKAVLSDNPAAQRSILVNVATSVKARVDALNEDLARMSGRKMRSDGARARLAECESIKRVIEGYEQVLQAPLGSLRELVDSVESQISVATALSYSA